MDDQDKLKVAIERGDDPWEIIGRYICYLDGIEADADWRDKGSIMLDVADDEPQNWKHTARKVERAIKRAGMMLTPRPAPTSGETS